MNYLSCPEWYPHDTARIVQSGNITLRCQDSIGSNTLIHDIICIASPLIGRWIPLLSASKTTVQVSRIQQEGAMMDAAVSELMRSRMRTKAYLLRTDQDLSRRQDRAELLASTGGSPGESC